MALLYIFTLYILLIDSIIDIYYIFVFINRSSLFMIQIRFIKTIISSKFIIIMFLKFFLIYCKKK